MLIINFFDLYFMRKLSKYGVWESRICDEKNCNFTRLKFKFYSNANDLLLAKQKHIVHITAHIYRMLPNFEWHWRNIPLHLCYHVFIYVLWIQLYVILMPCYIMYDAVYLTSEICKNTSSLKRPRLRYIFHPISFVHSSHTVKDIDMCSFPIKSIKKLIMCRKKSSRNIFFVWRSICFIRRPSISSLLGSLSALR